MEAAAAVPVSLPHETPTVSYWQDPPDKISSIRSTKELPSDADVVIIGSGITGASIAYNILTQDARKKIVMLEAREACSGATGRNGGHTKAASYRSFMPNVKILGLEEAIKIARLEYDNIREVHAFAKEHAIDCDLFPCDTVGIFFDQENRQDAEVAIDLMRKSMPEDLHGAAAYTFYTPEEAAMKFYCKGKPTFGAVQYFAGSLSAYKFVIGILKLALSKGLNLQTRTPALALQRSEISNDWKVETSRGIINTSSVILATNGYTAALYQPLQSIIVPLRGQITAHRPGSALPRALPTTYSFINAVDFEYMIQRPPGTKNAGDIVIGGGASLNFSDFGNTDDSGLDGSISEFLAGTTEAYFGAAWGDDDEKGRIRSEWSGVMGFTGDGGPWVGELPGETGLWICAAFQGHGMALCWKCARALSDMWVGSEEGLGSWFPQGWRPSEERLTTKFTGLLHG